MINKLEVGKRISNLRKTLNYSQSELAEKLDVSTQAVSKWETGATLPDIEILLKISWICNTSINAILEGDNFIDENVDIDRGLLRLNKLLICPKCKKLMKLNMQKSDTLIYECENNHQFHVVDGVVDFRTREIPGEQWSLSYRNYEEYLHEHYWPCNPNYSRGLNQSDVIWDEISELRPRVILDIACGTGQGIKHQIKRINWPVTIIMVDLSHRILKWNKIFYSTEWRNPYVEMIYLACDGANLPILSESVDLVFSYSGYESMQAKMIDGFREANRVLKSKKHTVYNKSVIESFESENSLKWMNLLLSSVNEEEKVWWKNEFVDVERWLSICTSSGFIVNKSTQIYGELPIPDYDTFPFENEMAQWMAQYIFVSQKP
ncbi:MAG: hypothetical protein K0S47_3071 [Herbinix sp.]|jgi:transcriptional regulator with XRE-family HTH domain/ubiquinone/menaquinone biosynthesis C-methylase UbiE|nr:hypothetical protein [Herbinix sp.]